MNRASEESFKSRIRNLASEKRIDTAQLWRSLILERFLVRLSHSKHSTHFVLKGGVLLSHYIDLKRHTQDLDFHVRSLDGKITDLERTVTDITKIPVEDGFQFTNLKIVPLLHPHMKYPGFRATMISFFGKTRFPVSLDLGFGDLIFSTEIMIPLTKTKSGPLFENQIELNGYPKEFIFAEKLETIVYRGSENSRMKDFHDIRLLTQSRQLDPKRTKEVIQMVFTHRGTATDFPIHFNKSELTHLQRFWSAHLRGLPRDNTMPTLFSEVIFDINSWLKEIL